jgi:outer membrane protein OmpA-like peptidoglycan-associated protein
MIGQYLKQDQDLALVLLDGYADSYGGKWKNEELSVERSQKIKDYFVKQGVDPERIALTGHGERRHIAPNTHESGRALNRRVVIQMSKP